MSAVSLWEIAIKHALARQQMPVRAAEARQAFVDAGYGLLAIAPDHVVAIEVLPPWHRDPFDRLLVAQAITEPLRLVTADAALARYSDVVMLVRSQVSRGTPPCGLLAPLEHRDRGPSIVGQESWPM